MKHFFKFFGSVIVSAIIVAILLSVTELVSGYTLQNDEEAYWPEGEVNIDFFDLGTIINGEVCTSEQVTAIEEAASYFANFMTLVDPNRTFSYTGKTMFNGYNRWRNDSTITIMCEYESQMMGVYGGAVRHIENGRQLDAGIKISKDTPLDLVKVVTVHELVHTLGINHSTVSDSLMLANTPTFPLAKQLRETIGTDTLCAIQAKYKAAGQELDTSYMKAPSLDDRAWLHVPWIQWLGKDWKLVLVNDGTEKWTVSQLKTAKDCSWLDEY